MHLGAVEAPRFGHSQEYEQIFFGQFSVSEELDFILLGLLGNFLLENNSWGEGRLPLLIYKRLNSDFSQTDWVLDSLNS